MPDNPTVTLLIAVVGVIGTLLAGLVGVIGTLITQWLGKRSEERKHLREIVIQTAMEHYKILIAEADKQNAAGKTVIMPPLDSYIIHMVKLVDVCAAQNLTPEKVRALMRETYAVTNAAEEVISENQPKP